MANNTTKPEQLTCIVNDLVIYYSILKVCLCSDVGEASD